MNSRFVLGASWVVAVTLLGGCGDSGSGGNTQSGGATSGGFGGIGGFGGSGGSAATAGQAGSSGSAGAAASGGTAGSSGAGGSAGAAASGGGGTGGGGTGGGGTGGSAATAWVRTLNTAGDTELIDAVAWPAGGIVALGRTSAYGAGDSDLAVISIAADGGIRWAKSLGGTDRETPGGVTLTDSGDILVVGATYSHSPARWEDGWVIRLDGTGKTVWQKSIGTNSLEGFSSVLAIGGDRYLLGGTAGIKTVYSGWLVEINGSGTIQWQHHYDSPGRGLDVRSIVRSPNGDLTLVGTAAQFTSPNDVDGLLVRLDPARKILWSRAFSGPMQSSSQAVTLADALARSDGSVVVAGHVASPGDTSDKATAAVAFQVDSSGALKWSRTVSATGKTTRATGLVASGSGTTLFGSTTAYAAGSTRRPLLLELSASGALQSQLGLGATYSAGLSGGTLAGAGELYGVGFDNQSSGSPRRWS